MAPTVAFGFDRSQILPDISSVLPPQKRVLTKKVLREEVPKKRFLMCSPRKGLHRPRLPNISTILPARDMDQAHNVTLKTEDHLAPSGRSAALKRPEHHQVRQFDIPPASNRLQDRLLPPSQLSSDLPGDCSSRLPLDVPLHIDTNINYELDYELFPGLSANTEPALIFASQLGMYIIIYYKY